ncbi:MAG: hypothetical protein V1773_04720 [bacterium]
MKKYLIMFLFAFDLFAQIDANTPKALKEFIQMRDSLVENFAEKKGFTKTFSDKEIFDITKIFYTLIKDNPVEYMSYIYEEHKRVDQEIRQGKNNLKNLPKYKLGKLNILITNQYGKKFAEILGNPYFLRVRILKITPWIYHSISANSDFKAFSMECQIEEVVKGENRFKVNDVVTINLLAYWLEEINSIFEINKSYFLPVKTWGCYDGFCEKLAINPFSDENGAIYPIIEEIVYTTKNYFNIGEKTNWEEFKTKFKEKYINLFELEGKED